MIKKITVVVIFFIAACQQKTPEQQLRAFVEDPDNKITQKISVGDVGVVTRFLPSSYRSLIEEKKHSINTDGDDYYYFDVTFNKNTLEKPSKEKLLYLNFDMANDFVLLVNSRDSITPAICQRIENGKSGDHEYIVAFEKKEEGDWRDFTLIYNDKVFSIGTVAFVYNEMDISKIPGQKDNDLK